ncbi:MAG: AMP-binding protein, partial [Pseudomonadota bacterium]
MTLAHWLDRAAAGFPDWPAVAHGTKVHQTYGQLAERAARLAAGLNRLGIMQGDRVAIAAKNGPAYLEILFAGWWANLALVPINAKLHGAEIGDSLEQSGAKACFATGDIANGIDAHRPDTLAHLIEIGTPDYEALFSAEPAPRRSTGPDDLAWLFFTSGTTGRPKGAMLSHRNLMAMSWAYLADVDPTPMGSPILHSAPMSHGSGMYIKPHVLRLGVNVVPESGGFDPLEIAHLFNHWRDASMFAAPTMIKRLVDADVAIDPGAIRTIVWGGAPMYVEDA